MSSTKTRQDNYRHRKDLEICIGHYLKEIKTNPPDHFKLKHNLSELELCIREYILLNKAKGKTLSQIKKGEKK